MRGVRAVLILSGLSMVVACSGERRSDSDRDDASNKEHREVASTASVSLDPHSITAADLALGDSVFHGLKGATSCQACHGVNANQGTVAPDLTDKEWLHSDGSFEGIYNTIKSGVMAPKKFSGVMPPFGGAPMDPTSHRAVAAYVYRLSHKE